MYRFITFIIFSLIFFCRLPAAFSQDVTILYTGQTHASLYPCHCPFQPDGGLARRATKIKEIRKQNPDTLLVDSGGFFAGGVSDIYSQNAELDKLRTQITLDAMGLMNYDAVAVGDDEFNFGEEFLFDEISQSEIVFLSSNIESEHFLPGIIKEISGVKFGILAFTPHETNIKSIIVSETIAQLKAKGADIIVLLSHLGEEKDLELASEVGGIDIIITGGKIIKNKEPYAKLGSTLFLRPAWQGKKLGRCDLNIKDGKITDFKVEQIRMSSDIPDDPDINKILPECFSDRDCKKLKFKGKCVSAATTDAHCEFTQPTKIDLTVIQPERSKLPLNTEQIIKNIERYLPNLDVKYFNYPSREAKKLIKKLDIKTLPAYILPREIEEEEIFSKLNPILDKKDKMYSLKPSISGVSFFLGRKRIENRVDVFLTLKEKNVYQLLEVLKKLNNKYKDEIDLHIHFAKDYTKNITEEYLRQVLIMYHYPLSWWDYVICRSQDIENSWWETCAQDMDSGLIKSEAQFENAKSLLKENIKLTEELGIGNTPTFLFENQEIFSTQDVPTLEELEMTILGGVR